MSNPSQLFLLADHIKLSLLERQRAISLKLPPNQSQDSNISRSLEAFREGIESLATRTSDKDSISKLHSQYDDLARQFFGGGTDTSEETVTSPNNPTLKDDFARAQSRRKSQDENIPQSQLAKSLSNTKQKDSITSKNVRFRDNPSATAIEEEDEANRAALFPQRYTDEPTAPDPTNDMSNDQIHQYHQQVLQEQDDQLDRLGESIGRQRYLALQVGDELEGQVALLDEVDRGVDRHQSRLDGAKRKLKTVSQRAKANWGMTTIIILIVILVLLIVILK